MCGKKKNGKRPEKTRARRGEKRDEVGVESKDG